MKRLFLIVAAIAALAFGSVAANATSFSVSPWAYSCGHTDFGTTVTRADTPGSNGCPATDVAGDSAAATGALGSRLAFEPAAKRVEGERSSGKERADHR